MSIDEGNWGDFATREVSGITVTLNGKASQAEGGLDRSQAGFTVTSLEKRALTRNHMTWWRT